MPTSRAVPRYERMVGEAMTESSRPLSAVVASKGTGARTVRIASSQPDAIKHTVIGTSETRIAITPPI